MTLLHPVAGDRSTPADSFSASLDVTSGRIRASGELDLCTAPILIDAAHVLDGLAPGPVVIDLSDVSFCDAAGLNALVTIAHEHEEQGRHLIVGGVSRRLRRVFAAGRASWLLAARPDVLVARPHGA